MIISTDSTANLPKDLYKELNISMIPMQIILEGETYDDLSEALGNEEYYDKMRKGATPTTAQINEYSAKEYFTNLLKNGEDIFHISFSSALSGTCNTMTRVANELNEINENKIVVIDSLNACMGEGLLVLKAVELKNIGKTINEIESEIKKLIPNVRSYFTVEQLKYLVRGGRVSKFSGVVGSVLNIKPILRVDENGKLVSYKKVITRKKSLSELVKITTEQIADINYVYICHTVCKEEAEELANSLKSALNVNPIITDLTQVIGCHTGPGLIAVFFFGNKTVVK